MISHPKGGMTVSKKSYTWGPFARNMIREYPKRRKCDKLGLHEQAEQNAVEAAIKKTRQKPDGEHRYKLIELTYLRRARTTLYRSAAEIPVSYATARRWNYEFFCDVAEAFGIYGPE